jgi:hypothetical protein
MIAAISKAVGWKYHTAKIRTINEARAAYKAALAFSANNPSPQQQGEGGK